MVYLICLISVTKWDCYYLQISSCMLSLLKSNTDTINGLMGSIYIHKLDNNSCYYKISFILDTLWLLVSYCVYIKLRKHGCDVTAYFLALFIKEI